MSKNFYSGNDARSARENSQWCTAISVLGASAPSKGALELVDEYICGNIKISDISKKTVNGIKYQYENNMLIQKKNNTHMH